MTELIHPEAARLFSGSLGPDDRTLVIGATGWFGRTATALLAMSGNRHLLVASRDREFAAGPHRARAMAWDWDSIVRFSPTVVLDCAFLTRDLVDGMALGDYVDRNRELTSRMLAVAGLDSVSRVVTVSSGAAVHPVDAMTLPLGTNPYGRLKREAEQALSELAAERGISAVVARAWSVSGAFVQKPRSYALSDMILQAIGGGIQITATTPVYRRYVSVEDLIAVSLASAAAGPARVIDSGGELVEMAQLAALVVAEVNPSATITRSPMGGGEANAYYADPDDWDEACRAAGFSAADLAAQIRTASAGLAITS